MEINQIEAGEDGIIEPEKVKRTCCRRGAKVKKLSKKELKAQEELEKQEKEAKDKEDADAAA